MQRQNSPDDNKIHTQQKIRDYNVSVWQNRTNDDPPYFLLVENTLTHKRDTLELTNITTMQDQKVEMGDLTKKTALLPLTLQGHVLYSDDT